MRRCRGPGTIDIYSRYTLPKVWGNLHKIKKGYPFNNEVYILCSAMQLRYSLQSFIIYQFSTLSSIKAAMEYINDFPDPVGNMPKVSSPLIIFKSTSICLSLHELIG